MKPFRIFVASWCRPCKKLKRHIDELEQAAKLDTTQIEMVDIDTSDGNQEAQKYNIKGVPTIIQLDDKGTAIDVTVGYRTPDQLLSTLSKISTV